MGVCVAGVNVKGECRLWSPGSQQQCFGTRPFVIDTYKCITLYLMIFVLPNRHFWVSYLGCSLMRPSTTLG